MKHHPRIFRWFLKTTDIMKGPVDKDLDQEIEKVSFILKEFYPIFKKILWKKILRFFRYWGWLRFFLRILTIFIIVAITYYLTVNYVRPIISPNATKTVTKEVYIRNMRPYAEFVQKVGYMESRYDWNIVKGQYRGYFQFGEEAFQACKKAGLDIDKLGRDNFLKNQDLQKVYFKELLRLNQKELKSVIEKYDMTEQPFVNGTITESGILMAAHLRGSSAVREFFRTKGVTNLKDGNETSVKDYIEEFSGYFIDI